jgi:predicted nuclease of predicted toxin-antitoxin system
VRFLANENFPLRSVRLLRSAGLDVAAIAEDSPGATDAAVIDRAATEQRVILTFDRDYGELIYRLRAPTPAGIVYLRFRPRNPEEPAMCLQRLLNEEALLLVGKFTVLDRRQARQRPLP